MKYTLPGGEEVSIDLSPEAARELQAKRLASPDQEPDLFADLDAAPQQLKKLRLSGETDFKLKRLNDGTVQVVADDAFSIGRTAAQIQEDLKLERKNREQILKESKTMPGPEAGLEQGTNRVQPLRQTPVTLQSTIPGLPKLPGR
jgi:hypothetical protein